MSEKSLLYSCAQALRFHAHDVLNYDGRLCTALLACALPDASNILTSHLSLGRYQANRGNCWHMYMRLSVDTAEPFVTGIKYALRRSCEPPRLRHADKLLRIIQRVNYRLSPFEIEVCARAAIWIVEPALVLRYMCKDIDLDLHHIEPAFTAEAIVCRNKIIETFILETE